MSVQWPRAQEFAQWIIPLATALGLVCFDPQSGQVHNPAPPGASVRLEFSDGGVVDGLRLEDLRGLLQQISEHNW
jgi:hypothetical protein